MIKILPSSQASKLLTRRKTRLTEAEATVAPILEDVRKRGDKAVLAYARKFDGYKSKSLSSSPRRRWKPPLARLTPSFRAAVGMSESNVREFALRQLPHDHQKLLKPGLSLGQIVRPLDTVAAYIPGGRYPLPSTLIMTVVPAQVAGVPNICACSPSAVDEVFGTAHILKVSQVFQMGGAQAIAAFAYGTATVPKADRIVGPGNIYVAAAKKLLAGETGIDFVAGPTEILIIAADGDPRFPRRRRHAGPGRARRRRQRHSPHHLAVFGPGGRPSYRRTTHDARHRGCGLCRHQAE